MTSHTPRSIRIFLSSTFRDFGEERDLLVRQVFPALREKLRTRFVELVDVDLRWGIKAEEAERGEVLPICLAEIDRARPYFIGLLGERYGWVPPAHSYAADLLGRQPWLEQHQGGKSVTELEILHGALDNPSMKGRVFFYFRGRGYARAKGGDFVPGTPADRRRQADLKRRIRASHYPVSTYGTPETLATRVERDLWRLLDAQFPASSVPDAFERDSIRHEAYAASRCQLFLGAESSHAALANALTRGDQRILIEGATGSGKSALLANFFSHENRRPAEHRVLQHYLRAGVNAAEAHAMVERMIEFIQRRIGNTDKKISDPQELLASLPTWLDAAGRWAVEHHTRFIFVLIGLEGLATQQDLKWWPAIIPEGVAFVVSCGGGPVRQALDDKAQALDESGPGWTVITADPLAKSERRALLISYLARFNKALPDELATRALAHPLSASPLFIRTLAEEMRLFGVHEELSLHLDHYLESESLDDLFERVLQRVESDCGKTRVATAMQLIWASRAGLTEKEILALAGLVPVAWATIRNALGEALLELGGRIVIAHEYMRKAIEDRYLATDSRRRRAHLAVARWFSTQPPDTRRAQEEPWQLQRIGDAARLRRTLQDPALFLALWEFNQTELLAYWKEHWQERKLLADYQKAHHQWRAQRARLGRIWHRLTCALADALWEAGKYSAFGAAVQIDARNLVARKHGAQSPDAARRDIDCAHYLHHLADPASIRHAERAVQYLEPAGPSLDLLSAYVAMAAVLDANGRPWDADNYSRRAIAALDDLPDSGRKAQVRHTAVLGWFFNSFTRPQEAQPVLADLVEQEERILGREDRRTLESVDCLVGSLLGCERFAEATNLAMSLYLRCYRTFGEDHLQTGYAAGKYGRAKLALDDMDSAEWGLSKAAEILKRNYPDEHQSRTVFHEALATCLEKMGKPEEAKAIRDELTQGMLGRFFDRPPSQTD